MKYGNYIELLGIDGHLFLIERDWDKVYKLHEITRLRMHFKKSFPFISFSLKKYLRFKFRTHYETINSCADPWYTVDYTPSAFAHLFGVKAKSYEEVSIENDLYA